MRALCNCKCLQAVKFWHGKVGQDHVRLEFVELPPKFDRSFYPVCVTAHLGAVEFSHDELGVARAVLDHQDPELSAHGNLLLHVNMLIKSIILPLIIHCRLAIGVTWNVPVLSNQHLWVPSCKRYL